MTAFARAVPLLLLLLLAFAWPRAAVAGRPGDREPQRFLAIPDWNGTLGTQAQSSGEIHDGDTTYTYSSSVVVRARFHLSEVRDRRDGNRPSWRGRGEARVRVVGRSVSRSDHEVVTSTYEGDYLDTFTLYITNLDCVKRTYEIAVVRDPWQKQPDKGEAIHCRTTTVNKYGTRVQNFTRAGHSWCDDGGAGISGVHRLPKRGFVVNGTCTSQNDDYLSTNGSFWMTQWSFRPDDPRFEEPLRADAGGTISVPRGSTPTLDGIASTGRITSYHWTFQPVDTKTVPFNSGAAKEGRRVPVTLLGTVKATLTVSDGRREDSDTVLLHVFDRDFHTPFVHRTEEKLHPRSIAPRRIKEHDVAYVGGENVCALCDYFAKDSVHRLHPDPAGDTWDQRGYTLRQVADPGGPFDGDWYADSFLLRCEREVLINKYIVQGGPPPVSTAKPFYEANVALGHDVEAYLKAVRRHELLHSERMQQSLAVNDPGPKLEAMATRSREEMQKKADALIRSAEETISDFSGDPLPSIGYKAPMAFPDDATDEYITLEMKL